MKRNVRRKKKFFLPRSFKPLFWSYDFSRIDPIKYSQTIIVNTINYGDLKDWKLLVRFYGKKEIIKTLTDIPATALRPQVRRLASFLFNIKDFNYALRGARRER